MKPSRWPTAATSADCMAVRECILTACSRTLTIRAVAATSRGNTLYN